MESAGREQLRAIRTHAKLSLVVVSIDETAKFSPEELFALSKTVQLQIRETDFLGWYAENALALLLPHTGEEGARECIDRIKAQKNRLPLSFELIECSEVPFFFGQSAQRVALQPETIDSGPTMLPQSQLVLKRLLDICGSLVGIVLLSPVMIAAAIAVKATSKGPIIFRQVRLGRDGKHFTFFKFRSMKADADQNVHRQHVERLIANGAKDEDTGASKAWFKMEAYSPWHLRRILEVKPGITGLWQVEGRGAITFDDMVRMDLQYARHWTVLMDVRILLNTIPVVLQRRGAG
jgi:lipopolysaccharide/colanic/teichoic acid biosynthesis glycosyltransferase